MSPETLPVHPIIIYLAAISFVTFALFAIDKWKAQSGQWRISEKVLLNLCLLGGSAGGAGAMMLLRHKVSKKTFLRRYFAIVALQLVAMVIWWWYLR